MKRNLPIRHCSGYTPPDGQPARPPHEAPQAHFSPSCSRCRACEAYRLRTKRDRERAKQRAAAPPLVVACRARKRDPSILVLTPEPTSIFPPGFVKPLDRIKAKRRAELIASGELIELKG